MPPIRPGESFTYRFPILQNIDRQLALFYLRDIYGGIFFEAGNAFESGFNGPTYKKSLGYEVRMRLGSYYIFPTAISFAAAYAFDPVAFLDPGIAGVPVLKVQQPGFSYYFTLGFQFDS